MDSYLKPDERIEKYERKEEEEVERRQSDATGRRRKKRRRLRAKNFRPSRILLHVTHTRDKIKDSQCVIL